MAKHISLGNGNTLIGLDKYGQVRDLYFHYAGLENHVSEHLVHKIGIWANDYLSWIDDGSWKVVVESEKETMASAITAENQSQGLKLFFTDILYNEENIFIRKVTVTNLHDVGRKIKVFFNAQFNISQSHVGDTAYWDPYDNVLIHYKGRRVFLANAKVDDQGISDYSVGIFGIEGKDGTFRDAEDGVLTKNPIEHGQVDSVLAVEMELKPRQSKVFYYWLCIGKSIRKVKRLNNIIGTRGPEDIIKTTKDYWHAWVNNQNFSFYGLSDEIVDIFKKSLITIRTHVSRNGAIIASGDSGMLQYGRDTYSYVWPRDGAFCVMALTRAGDFNASRRFFEYCRDIIMPEGYFMHKYRPDKSLGSSWHPWVGNGVAQLPIQEDETALVLIALWNYFELSKDLEFVEGVYNRLIKSASEFMVKYRDSKTGLPKPSYDLWEMKTGVSTFTASTVYAALVASSKFATLLGKDKSAAKYLKAAGEIKEGILKYLYDPKEKYFYKHINFIGNKIDIDKTVDMSSAYGVWRFGVLDIHDEKLKSAYEVSINRLEVKTEVGGIARFEADSYCGFGGNVPGNPWIITTLWLAQYYIDFLTSEQELPAIVKRFTWAVNKALPSGILSEQLNPYTGELVSATPLVWSHAEFVITIIKYLEKLEELDICKACYPLNIGRKLAG